MDELLDQFLIEGRELAQQATDDLLALERRPDDIARLDGAFRAVHTLKGSTGLFDLAPMGRALHAAEDLLGAIRSGGIAPERRAIDAALGCIGACEEWLDAIATTTVLPDDAEARSAGVLAALLDAMSLPTSEAAPAASAPDAWLQPLVQQNRTAVLRAQGDGATVTALRYEPGPDCFFLGDDPLGLVRTLPDLIGLRLSGIDSGTGTTHEPFLCRIVIEALTTASPDAARAALRFVADQVRIVPVPVAPTGPSALVPPRTAGGERLLRVDPAAVDDLLALVDELIVAKNGLAHAAGRVAGADALALRAFADRRAEVDRLVVDLHAAALRLRMTPLAQTFRRLPKVVRDTAARLGKTIDFEIDGEGVELEKAVVEGLYEPLLHILRNAVDHGIEGSAVRVAAGKRSTGRIGLRARRDGDAIEISVDHDGAGLDAALIGRKAVARGLLDQTALERLDEAAVLDLVFAPGLSTAAAVTDISGRGVGLDAVRTAVGALGGRVVVSSRPGAGCEFRFLLPASTSVTTVLTVQAGTERFGVPLDAVIETVRLPAAGILTAGYGEAFVLRDRTVPLLPLAGLIGRPVPIRRGHTLVLVCVQDGVPVGIEVDAVGDRLDVLLRPINGLLAAIPGLLGTALLGDGQVLLVLDMGVLIG